MPHPQPPHFMAPLELLPGESVLWQGPPAPGALRVLLLQSLMLLVLAVVLLAPFTWITSQIDDRTPAHASQPTDTATSPHAPSQRASRPSGLGWLFPLVFLAAFATVGGIFSALSFVFLLATLIRVPRSWYLLTTERVCIQSGWLTRSLVTVDLDKVISLRASSSWLQRRFRLHSIEVIHAGSRAAAPQAGFPASAFSSHAYTIAFVSLDSEILSVLSKAWLPRDNRTGTSNAQGAPRA